MRLKKFCSFGNQNNGRIFQSYRKENDLDFHVVSVSAGNMSPQTNYSLLSEAKPYSKTAPNNNNDFSVLLQLGCIPLISFILRYLLAFCCVMVCQMTAFSCGLAGGTIQNFLHLTITLFLLESIYSNLVLLPWREVTKLNDFFYKPRFRKRILRSSTAHEKFPSVETTS